MDMEYGLTDSALSGARQARWSTRSHRKGKTPLRGSGDTFAIALKGSFNNLLAVTGCFAQDTGDVEQNTATVR
jgi:hypothetical protein